MKRLSGYAILILLLSSLGLNGYFLFSQAHEMTVAEVHDGNTFTLGDGQRVRLLGADAPELPSFAEATAGRENCGAAQKAKDKLTSLVLNKKITLTEEKRDTYGRRMGLVWTGSTLVNEVMLKEGLARPDYTPNSQNERLKAAYRDATDRDRGIHSTMCKHTAPVPPNKTCVIKGNIDKATGDHFYQPAATTTKSYWMKIWEKDFSVPKKRHKKPISAWRRIVYGSPLCYPYKTLPLATFCPICIMVCRERS